MSNIGIFDDLVASARRIDFGSNAPGQSPSIVAGFGVPVAIEATGSVYYRQDAPNASLMLYVRSNNAWWPISSAATFTGVSVNTEALLTAFDVTSVPDGALAWVGNPAGGAGQSQDSTWQLVTQVGALPALVAHEVIASPTAGRVWQRRTNVSTPRWAQQANWFLDPAGDDQNDGATNGTALASLSEIARRVPVVGAVAAIVVTCAAGNYGDFQWTPSWRGTGAAPIITILGTRTLGANLVVASSSDEAAAAAPLIDAGAALTVGRLIQATSGAQNGATAAVVSLVAGTQYELSPWRNAAGARVVPPAINDTIAVVTNPGTPRLSVGGTGFANQTPGAPVVVQNFSTPLVTMNGYTSVSLITCDLQLASAHAMTSGGLLLLSGCAVLQSASVFNCQNGRMLLSLCGFNRVGLTSSIEVLETVGRISLTNCVIRGGNGVAARTGGLLGINRVGIFGSPTTAVDASVRGLISITGTLYGDASNAGKGTRARSGGGIFVAPNVTPTLASTGQELELEAAATANPTTAGVPVAAVGLTSWNGANAWTNALTFNRKAVSYTSGACVTDATA